MLTIYPVISATLFIQISLNVPLHPTQPNPGTPYCPQLVSILAGACLLESPRWLLVNGHHAEAEAVMHTIARTNGRELPEGFALEKVAVAVAVPVVVVAGTSKAGTGTNVGTTTSERKGLAGLFTRKLRFVTLCTWVVWLGFGLSYYGLVFLITHVVFLKGGQTHDSADYGSADYGSADGSMGGVGGVGRVDGVGGHDGVTRIPLLRSGEGEGEGEGGARRTSGAASDTCDFDYPSTFVNAVRYTKF